MSIIQIGYAKSGNFWLYSILQELIQIRGPIKSFVKSTPAHSHVDHSKLSFKGQADVDVLDITENGFSWRISSLYQEEIQNLKEYVHCTSLVWTHSPYCSNSTQLLKEFDNSLYNIKISFYFKKKKKKKIFNEKERK